MKRIEFRIKQVPAGTQTHSWMALDVSSGAAIDIPTDGKDSMLGKYPTIQQYIWKTHNVDVELTYDSQTEEGGQLETHGDGTCTWTYSNPDALVLIHDIPRVLMSIATA